MTLNPGLVIVVLGIYLLVRNFYVCKYRMAILDKCKKDIAEGRSCSWKLDLFETVSYEQMLFKFWRRLDSFYPIDLTKEQIK